MRPGNLRLRLDQLDPVLKNEESGLLRAMSRSPRREVNDAEVV